MNKEYKDEVNIMELMNDIEYGWIDKNNNPHITVDNFSDNYRLQSPNKLIKTKLGVCWDQVELERKYFSENSFNIKTYFIVYYDNDKCPTHTFLTFNKNNKVYWFEHSYEKFRGIHEYNTIRELLLDVANKFIKDTTESNYDKKNLLMFEYKRPEYNISTQDFYNHCEKGNKVDIDSL